MEVHSTWLPAAVQITHIHTASGTSPEHGPQHGLLWERGSRTPTWPQTAAQSADINTASSSSTGRGRYGGLQGQPRTWRLNPENEPVYIEDNFLLLRATVIVRLGRTFRASACESSRQQTTTTLPARPATSSCLGLSALPSQLSLLLL